MDEWIVEHPTRMRISGHWPQLVEALEAAIEEIRKGNHAPQGFKPVEASVRPSASGQAYTAEIVYEQRPVSE